MRPRRANLHKLAATLAAACASAAATARAAAVEDTVTLSVAGREGARVRGWCVLDTAEGELRVEFDEAVPFERRWRASGLRCDLETPGARATAELVRGGGLGRSRASSGGGRIRFSIR